MLTKALITNAKEEANAAIQHFEKKDRELLVAKNALESLRTSKADCERELLVSR